jgi:hypothetical protein
VWRKYNSVGGIVRVAIELSVDRLSPEGRLLEDLNREGMLSQAFLAAHPVLESNTGRMLLFTAQLTDPAFGKAIRVLAEHVNERRAKEALAWDALRMKLLSCWWNRKIGRAPRKKR